MGLLRYTTHRADPHPRACCLITFRETLSAYKVNNQTVVTHATAPASDAESINSASSQLFNIPNVPPGWMRRSCPLKYTRVLPCPVMALRPWENEAKLHGERFIVWNARKRTECRTNDIRPPWLNAFACFHQNPAPQVPFRPLRCGNSLYPKLNRPAVPAKTERQASVLRGRNQCLAAG